EKMSEPDTSSATSPASAPQRPAESEREARLAEALRANLHRRKAQARARRDQPAAPDSGTGEG
ncbi:hypothetical protein ABTM57_20490, partial [Acinetobacter baumannii]